jgi:hypothetical protein
VIAGAYMYSFADQLSHWSAWDLSPTNIYRVTFRLAIAVPLGYALSYFGTGIAVFVVFLIGAFPTNTLMKIIRRLAAKRLDISDIRLLRHGRREGLVPKVPF